MKIRKANPHPNPLPQAGEGNIWRSRLWIVIMLGFINVAWAGNNQSLTFTLSSAAFSEGKTIPKLYTCDDKNISPPLTWQGTPHAAKTLALTINDPDAPSGAWYHWVLFNIPPTSSSLSAGISHFPKGTMVGQNSWRRANYSGPCPPMGEHHYVFTLYALDSMLSLPAVAVDGQRLEKAIQGHIIAETQLTGNYHH